MSRRATIALIAASVGCSILVVTVAAVVLVRVRAGFPHPGQGQGGQRGVGEAPAALVAVDDWTLAKHPWWRKKVTPAQVRKIVGEIELLVGGDEPLKRGRRQILFIAPTGEAKKLQGAVALGDGPTFGTLEGKGLDTEILIVPGRLTVSHLYARDESRLLLKTMLDKALASDVRAKATGWGDGNFDRLLRSAEEFGNDPKHIEEDRKMKEEWDKIRATPLEPGGFVRDQQ